MLTPIQPHTALEQTISPTTETRPHQIEPLIAQAANLALQQLSQHVSHLHDYTLKTTTQSAAQLDQMLSELEQMKHQDPSTPVALINGGSIAGYAAALRLFKLGFHVIVAEKRPAYTRKNSFILKKEAFFSLSSSAPDGSLLQELIDQHLLDVHHTNLVKQELGQTPMDIEAKPNSITHMMRWLLPLVQDQTSPTQKRPVLVPQYAPNHKAALGHLDVAWPKNRPLAPVSADQWRYGDLSKIGEENLGLCQIRNLEKGLNAYCAKQIKQENTGTRRIHIVQAEVELSPENQTASNFRPCFKLPNQERVNTQLPFNLICIAEGANSHNAEKLGKSFALPTKPTHVESWYQANYTAPKQGLHGFFGSIVDKSDQKITAVQHMERANNALINVSLGVPPEHALDQSAINTAIVHAEHLCKTAGLNIKLTPNNRELETKRIDVVLKRAAKPMVGNVVMIGDAAGSGSPVGALGGSLSLAAYPEALERLVTHPSFNKPNELDVLQKAYEKDITDIVSIRHGKSTAIMQSLNFYDTDTALRHTYPQLHADAETRKTQHNSSSTQ